MITSDFVEVHDQLSSHSLEEQEDERSGSDFFSGSSDNYIPSDESNAESSSDDSTIKKTVPLEKGESYTMEKNINKKNRMSGLPHESRGRVKAAKKPKFSNCNSCKFKCSLDFNDELRNQLCSKFWNLDFNRQKDFIVSYVTSKEPACRRIRTGTGAHKSRSRYYHFLKEGTRPKKDQRSICANYLKEKSADLEENYQAHIRRRDEANAAKKSDKERAMTDNNFVSVTFDLQSILQIPSSDVSLMYYSRKLCAYNLTIYEAASQEAHCYTWIEINGQRGSSEIGTCLVKWIQNLPQNITELNLFSDTCSGQNRNQYIAALFVFLVQNSSLNIIEHNFLESGHSCMEIDSMHSAIENAKRNVPVYTMHDWLNIFRMARSNRGRNKRSPPYNVHELKYKDFLDLKKLASRTFKNRSIDESGNRVNWLKIKSMRYEKNLPQYVLFKYNYSDPEFLRLNVAGRSSRTTNNILPDKIPQLYSKEIPISNLKKLDFLKLCRTGAIPPEFHAWYQSIPTDSAKKDVAPEPSLWSDSDSA
ncbi:unnamed protein product [Phaedon cochleariae]|uniref:DUF7869 domain-containing protein n=1 Tax=Phaedon cochleariae TaxID=80249 RepID=A0A9N9SJ67_PHACE|nr:unnamed protein product [Phaedon cochleariae]